MALSCLLSLTKESRASMVWAAASDCVHNLAQISHREPVPQCIAEQCLKGLDLSVVLCIAYICDKVRVRMCQVLPEAPVCTLVSLNLLQVEKPTYHIAPYLPSVKASTAPLLFIWHVSCSSMGMYFFFICD